MSIADPASVKPIPKDAAKVFQGRSFSVWQWPQVLFDGTTVTFERISRQDYAYIIAVLPDQKILLVEDQQPDRDTVITGAGGGVEDKENPAQAAQRELLEETGYTCAEVLFWHSYRPAHKIDMLTHAFIGRGAKKTQEPHPEPGEKIKVIIFSFDEFLQLGSNYNLRDWMLRIKLLEATIDSDKRQELKNLLYDTR